MPANQQTDGNSFAENPLVFALVIASGFLVLSILTVWAATDASFQLGIWKVRAFLGLEETYSFAEMQTIRWDPLGKRAIALFTLLIAGCVTTALSCYLAIRHFRVWKFGSFLMLFFSFDALYLGQREIENGKLIRQVEPLLPQIERVATVLHKNWPTSSGEIEGEISYYVSPDDRPNILLVRGNKISYPWREQLGRFITQGNHGVLHFDLQAAYDCEVEYHPNRTKPERYVSGFGNLSPPVGSVIQLKESWYLVRYGGSERQ